MPEVDVDALGKTIVACGFVLGVAFGAISQRANFCTMGSIADVFSFGDRTRLRQWLLAIAVAVLGTNLLAAAGLIDTADSFYTAPRLLLLSHVVGGVLFGIGMVLAGGCPSKNFQALRLARNRFSSAGSNATSTTFGASGSAATRSISKPGGSVKLAFCS